MEEQKKTTTLKIDSDLQFHHTRVCQSAIICENFTGEAKEISLRLDRALF